MFRTFCSISGRRTTSLERQCYTTGRMHCALQTRWTKNVNLRRKRSSAVKCSMKLFIFVPSPHTPRAHEHMWIITHFHTHIQIARRLQVICLQCSQCLLTGNRRQSMSAKLKSPSVTDSGHEHGPEFRPDEDQP